MLPVPTASALASFTGRAADSFTTFAGEALAQATLLFSLRTRLTAMPAEPDRAQLAVNAILQMADRIYLEQPYASTSAGPFQTETIGSYTYAKQSTVSKVKDGSDTGLYWWDLAMDLLTEAVGDADVQWGSLHVFEPDLRIGEDGLTYIVGPGDVEQGPPYIRIS